MYNSYNWDHWCFLLKSQVFIVVSLYNTGMVSLHRTGVLFWSHCIALLWCCGLIADSFCIYVISVLKIVVSLWSHGIGAIFWSHWVQQKQIKHMASRVLLPHDLSSLVSVFYQWLCRCQPPLYEIDCIFGLIYL